MKPATQLPWPDHFAIGCWEREDSEYARHAANTLPAVVEALRMALDDNLYVNEIHPDVKAKMIAALSLADPRPTTEAR